MAKSRKTPFEVARDLSKARAKKTSYSFCEEADKIARKRKREQAKQAQGTSDCKEREQAFKDREKRLADLYASITGKEPVNQVNDRKEVTVPPVVREYGTKTTLHNVVCHSYSGQTRQQAKAMADAKEVLSKVK